MWIDRLKEYELILGSKSPRRKMLLEEMGLSFCVKSSEVDESYPSEMDLYEVPKYLAKKKAEPFLEKLSSKEILLTSDTVVILNGELIGKPQDEQDACKLLGKLSGNTHQVVSGVCITSVEKQIIESVVSKVRFRELSEDEISYYVQKYKPLDKAGSYGIQEWIGYIGIEEIKGSYSNIVGLPTATVCRMFRQFL